MSLSEGFVSDTEVVNDHEWNELAALLHSLGDGLDGETHHDPPPVGLGQPHGEGSVASHAIAHEGDLAAADAALNAALEETHTTLASCRELAEGQLGVDEEVSSWHDDTVSAISTLGAHLTDLRASFAALEHDLDGSRHEVREHHTAVRETIDGVSRETQTRHTQETQSAFDHLVDEIDSRCQGVIDDSFREFDDRVSRAFEQTEQEVQAHAHGLESFLTRLMVESAGRVTHDTLEELRRAFGEVLRHAIEALVEEVAAQTVSMTVGASATAALAPILPELVAARAALHLVNAVVDFFTPG